MLDIVAAIEVPLLNWSEIRVERLTAMWGQGFSASQIGGDLGITRNAVLGKLHRLGKSQDRPATKTKPSRGPDRNPRRPKPARPQLTRAQKAIQQREQRMVRLFGPVWNSEPAAPLVAPTGQSCSLQQLTDLTCRFPIGDPGAPDFHFCGAKSPLHHPYCAYHHQMCYAPRAPARKPFIVWGGR